MAQYFCRRWSESRGDEYDEWGSATYYFEASDSGEVLRQVEVYENGKVLRYGPHHREDDFGYLSMTPLLLADYAPFASDAEAFEQVWREGEVDPARLVESYRTHYRLSEGDRQQRLMAAADHFWAVEAVREAVESPGPRPARAAGQAHRGARRRLRIPGLRGCGPGRGHVEPGPDALGRAAV